MPEKVESQERKCSEKKQSQADPNFWLMAL